jgi:hypothetical protein
MQRRALTVSELTDACKPPDEETRLLWLRRVRDWSNIGIVPATRQHAGTGRHRLFRPDAVYVTAVLLRLVDSGYPIRNLSTVAKLINAPRRTAAEQEFHRFWRDAITLAKRQDAYVAFTPERGDQGTTSYRYRWGKMTTNDDDAWALMNLTRVFRKLAE